MEIFEILQERFFHLLTELFITYKRYFFNHIDFNDKLIGILGARGVGKTTFLLQYLKESIIPLEKKLYVSADSIELSDVSLFELANYFYKRGGELLIIDEIHKYPDFEKHLKQIYDVLNLKVIFSGSSALILEHAKTDLSRRAVIYRVNGLSFREFLELKTGLSLKSYSLKEILLNHLDISFEIVDKIKPFEHFYEYLKSGFYPFYFENPKTYLRKLEETINIVIEADLPFLFKIDFKNIIKLKKLVKLICLSEPFKLNLTKLSERIGINRATLYNYLHYLELGNIFCIIHAKSKGDSIFSKPEKIYLDNSNLYYCYCEKQNKGTIRETFVVSQLKNKYQLSYPKKGDLIVDGEYLMVIGGKNKDFSQIKDEGYLILDEIEIGRDRKIPLWLIGFVY